MSEEQEPQVTTTAKFESKLDSWDANQAAFDAKQWEESLLRQTEIGTKTKATPGVDDFSDAAKQRWEEAAAYSRYMEQFANQDGNVDERYQEAVDSGEVKDSIDRTIEASAELRRMDMLAREIAKLRAGERTADTDENSDIDRIIKEREDKLQELLAQFRDQNELKIDERLAHGPTEKQDVRQRVEMKGVELDAIIDRIIDHSSRSQTSEVMVDTPEGPTDSPEGEAGATDDTAENPSGDDSETAGDSSETTSSDTPETPAADTPETPGETPDGADEKGGEGDDTPQETNEDKPEQQDDKEKRAEREDAMFRHLDEMLDKYAEVTAKDRTHVVGRFFTQDTWFNRTLKRIPGVEGLINRLNDSDWSQEVQEAAANYEAALKECLTEFERISPDLSEQEKRTMETEFLLETDKALEAKIAAKQKEESSPASRFSNWWVSQEGFTGNLKKAGAVLLIGGAAGGVAAGIFGAAFGAAGVGIVGSVAGGLAGAATAQHVTSRRANSFVNGNVPEEEGLAYADAVAQQHLEFKQATMEDSMVEDGDSIDAAGNMVKANEHITDLEVLRNRYRLRRALSLGALAGGLAGSVTGNLVGNHFHPNTPTSTTPSDGGAHGPNHSGGSNPTPNTSGAEQAGQAAEHAGKMYSYDYGAAPENVLRQVAPDQLGQNLNGDQAYRLINQLYDKFGDHIFNGVKTLEHSPNNIWIQNPGGSTSGLTKEAAAFAKDLLASGKL